MRFQSRQEMDQNARKWLALLIPLALAFCVIGIVCIAVVTGGDDFIVNIAQLIAGHAPK